MGMYYNRARWYDPATGRFNRTDPFAGSPQDPQSVHKYLYAHCNPINSVDPTGETSLMEETTVQRITAEEVSISIAANILLLQQIWKLAVALTQRDVKQEVELFIQTAPEPFAQEDFDNLENTIRIRTRSKEKRLLYLHYSFDKNKGSLLPNGLFPAGVINPEGSFATRQVYPTGWMAKWSLALPNVLPPDAVYLVYPKEGYDPTSEGPVPSKLDDGGMWMGGGGYQYVFRWGSGGAGTVIGPKNLPEGDFGDWE